MSLRPKIVVIMANLGTPDAPDAASVRRFLKQFLSDQRVIEIPKFIWWLILNMFVLPSRPKRVAEAYQSIWLDDSPMRLTLFKQVEFVQQQLTAQFTNVDIEVIPAMTYGNPGIHDALLNIDTKSVDHVLLFPLFPQYSATSTAPLYDALSTWVKQQRNLPGISVIRDYYDHPEYIAALAQSVREYQATYGQADKLLMSFHGIPQPYADKGDPYADRCRITASKVATALGLSEDQWAISFQSRFGKQEWVKPYTNELLMTWAKQGIASVQVLSPAFSADCLETLEELAVENRDLFLEHGGQEYAYISALNDRPDHIALFSKLVAAHIVAIEQQFRPS